MAKSKDLSEDLSREVVSDFGKTIFSIDPKPKDGTEIWDTLPGKVAGLLLLFCLEAVKAVFRKNFGIGGIRKTGLTVSCIFFLGVAILCFTMMASNSEFAIYTGTSDAHLITGMLFIILSIFVFIRGNEHLRKASSNKYPYGFQGESSLLGFLKPEWSEENIQKWAEPITVLVIGGCFWMFNEIGSVAIIFCGLSVWGDIIIRWLFGRPSIHQDIEKLNTSHFNDDTFHKVKSDL